METVLKQDLQQPSNFITLEANGLRWEIFAGTIRVYSNLNPHSSLLECKVSSAFLQGLADHMKYLESFTVTEGGNGSSFSPLAGANEQSAEAKRDENKAYSKKRL